MAEGHSIKSGDTDRIRSRHWREIPECVDGKDADVCLGANGVNHGKPFAIRRHSYVRGRTRQGNRFIENAALAIGKKDGDGMAGGIAGVPSASGPLGYPARGVGGVRRSGTDDRKNITGLVDDSEAVGAVRRSESQIVFPEGFAKRRVICVAG